MRFLASVIAVPLLLVLAWLALNWVNCWRYGSPCEQCGQRVARGACCPNDNTLE
jgi:hypothetical protein